ncbi:MAG: sugar ABC transporter ATP-binding protein [Erysipelotrichaceae bacterium]
METILTMSNIKKSFGGVKALKDVSIDLRAGEALALIGENGAGKSTLMKILLGMYTKDAGEMQFKGKPHTPSSPRDSLTAGISMIHQEISLFSELSVSKNIWIGREDDFSRYGIIDEKSEIRATQALLEKLNIKLDPKAIVSSLSIANMQLVEIARAISYNSDIIIMDEPTSALTNVEVDQLFTIVRDLKQQGKSIIFISHKLEELLEICDRITVLKDGCFVATKDIADINKEQLIALMVGRDCLDLYPKEEVAIGDVVLRVNNLCRNGVFKDISFDVHAGEIVGLCGLMGAGRTEIAQSIFGIDPKCSGDVYIDGSLVDIKHTADAINHNIAMVTEDRLRSGAIHMHSVKNNMSLAYLNTISKFGFVNVKKEKQDCAEMVQSMQIKIANQNQSINALSGGNQQKVIIGKWLLTNPNVLILDEPTRGIDVGAKSEIYKLIGELAKAGKAILMISSELPEVMGISDRILVVHEGSITGSLPRAEFCEERLMKMAFGIKESLHEKI